MPLLRSASLTTPRLTWHYRLQGDADGLPLLLLHGSYATGRWWEPLLALLPDALLALAPDLRGCGGSTKSDGGYAIADQAADLWELVQALGWRNFDLVGHSTSGAICMEFALLHPEILHSLTLVDSVPVEGVFTPTESIMLLEQMRSDPELLSLGLAALMPTFDLSVADHELFFNLLVEDALNMAPAAFSALAIALNHWNRFAEARRLTLPTLLLWGDQDHVVDRDATTRTLVAIPGANNLDVLRNVGHSPMIEAPLTLAEHLIEFITEDDAEYAAIRDEAQPQAHNDA